MVAETDDATVPVETEKLALVLPAGTVTKAGRVADAVLLASETATPPVGAGPLSETVPVVDVPPVTLAGFIETDERETPTFAVRGMVTVDCAAITTLS